jgi:hypothetical protein
MTFETFIKKTSNIDENMGSENNELVGHLMAFCTWYFQGSDFTIEVFNHRSAVEVKCENKIISFCYKMSTANNIILQLYIDLYYQYPAITSYAICKAEYVLDITKYRTCVYNNIKYCIVD